MFSQKCSSYIFSWPEGPSPICAVAYSLTHRLTHPLPTWYKGFLGIFLSKKKAKSNALFRYCHSHAHAHAQACMHAKAKARLRKLNQDTKIVASDPKLGKGVPKVWHRVPKNVSLQKALPIFAFNRKIKQKQY